MSIINEYLAKVTESEKAEFERISKVVKQTVPDVTEAISYGMPTFKYKDKYLVAFYAFKNHMSIFPGGAVIKDFKDELKDFKTSKGTIQFTSEQPVSEALIKKIVLRRVADIDADVKTY